MAYPSQYRPLRPKAGQSDRWSSICWASTRNTYCIYATATSYFYGDIPVIFAVQLALMPVYTPVYNQSSTAMAGTKNTVGVFLGCYLH